MKFYDRGKEVSLLRGFEKRKSRAHIVVVTDLHYQGSFNMAG